ncbi:MAG: hypothetical protein EZS28_020449 [Streblomastix strix]|uniref:Uncharacterized protein n=1 Tax=Streblomastix strix TaxID=222440 RepID=A0A5J4VNU7_9EUKA|nr:MAG: hypothetical protein EZS28_020449 [Streblomastix strix]
MTLGTSQTITANKTFNNSCRFVSTIDGMSTVTGASFVKSGAYDTVVLLGAGGTKPISEFISAPTDLSNYYTKAETYAKNEVYSRRMLSLFARSDHRHILNVAPGTDIQPCVNGVANKALGFVKSGSDDTSVLLAGGGTKPISEFSSGAPDLSNYYTKTQTYSQTEANNKFVKFEGSIQQTVTGRLKYVSPFGETYDETQDPVANTYLTMSEVDAKLSSKMDSSTLGNLMNTIQDQTVNGSKTFTNNVSATGFAKTGKDDTSVLLAGGGDMLLSAFGGAVDITNVLYDNPTYLNTQNFTYYDVLFYKIGILHIFSVQTAPINTTSLPSVGIATIPTQYAPIIYIDEALLDAAGLMDFPELYAYIREREPRPPVETAPPVPVGEQTLQEQVKINADILENTNDVFVPPEPNMPVKIDYGQQIVNKPFIFNEMQPTLIVYGDRVTLNCFLTIKQQFKGYVFNSYPQEAQPKDNVKIITVICNNFSNNINLFCYIDENGPYVYAEDDREIAANTSIVISTTLYKQFEALKQINYDSNNDGKVDIMDVWNGSGQGTHEAQSHVYDVVKKQSDLVDHHIEGTVLHNFLNNDIKLIDKLGIYKADRAAYYIQDGPIVTFSFGAKLGDNVGNVYNIFSTIDSKILPPYAKYHAIHPEQKEFKGYCQQIQQQDKQTSFQVIISGKLDKKDCEFSGTYVIDNYQNLIDANEINEGQPESIIDEVIIKCDRKLETHSIYQYTITNEIGQLNIVQGFNLGSPHNSFYIVDDGALFPATVIITVGDSYQTDTFVGYFIVNGSTKQYSFSDDRPVVISPQSSNVLYYCVSGLYYLD